MSKVREKLCVLIAVLVLVTMTGTGVFADTVNENQSPADNQQTVVTDVDEPEAADPEVTEPEAADPEGVQEEQNADGEEILGEGEIVPQELPMANAVISVTPSVTFTGKPLTPAVTVTYDENTLTKDVDYTVTYANNLKWGTATVTVTGIGEVKDEAGNVVAIYTGTKTTTFKIVKPVIPAPTNVKALAGYNAIKVTWKASKGASYYYIQARAGSKKKVIRTRTTDAKETKACAWESIYRDKKKHKLKEGVKYNYTVYAVKKFPDGTVLKSKGVKTKKTAIVSQMYIKVTMKTTVGRLKSGKTYRAYGYGSGQYKIKKGSHTYSIARIRVKNQKAVYNKNGDLSDAAVEFFMNGGSRWAKGKKYSFIKKKGFSTSRSHFIWVSTVNQHVYVMKKSGKKWKVQDEWKCSMGKASTPSPTGKKTIIKFRAYHPGHGAPNWNFISWSSRLQHGTALHGLESGWAPKLGTLASHGCIRNPSEKAEQIHTKYGGNGTKVYIY